MKTNILVIFILLIITLMGCDSTPNVSPNRSIGASPTLNPTRQAQIAQAQSESVFIGEVVTPPVALQDFEMPSSTGETLHLSDLRGSWLVVFFGYLHCPDFCPLTLSEYKRVKKLLADDATRVRFVYISVDGVRDTPQAIREYLDNFDSEFIGFSGDDVTLAQIQPDYGFYYQRRLDEGEQAVYVIDHSTLSYLIDPDGFLVATFTYETDLRDITRAILWYLESQEV